MKIVYHMPFIETLTAGRTIYYGYKNAFEDLGHTFIPFTMNDNLEELLNSVQPDIFITSTHAYHQKFLNFQLLRKYRDKGMKVFVNTGYWESPINKLRINEAESLKADKKTVNLIKSGEYGDVFYNAVEQESASMGGFEESTGYKFYTIPLAVDAITLKDYKIVNKFTADISFIGTYLVSKRNFFEERVFPLRKKYNLKLYGEDWTRLDRSLGFVQKVGQYFNIPGLKSVRKAKINREDEGAIYASSTISINVHEEHQRKFGWDCNERTFKIPFCNGFEISDNIACIHKYFKVGEEIIVAENKQDWFDKIDYYIKNPDERLEIIAKGKARVAKDHTYHNRVEQIISIYKSL